jgi:hypothetical protein
VSECVRVVWCVYIYVCVCMNVCEASKKDAREKQRDKPYYRSERG